MLARIERSLAEREAENPEQLRKQIADLDRRMLAIVTHLDPGHADVANAAIAELKGERARLAARLSEVENQAEARDRLEDVAEVTATALRECGRIWKKATGAQRRALLACFVESVVEPGRLVGDDPLLPAPETEPGARRGVPPGARYQWNW